MKETVHTINKKPAGEVELSEEIFTAKVNTALLYEAVKMHRANQREGTAATRNHCMVSGTTAKMYRQKGTGRARHGDARTNIFVGGGKAFGPHPRDYGYRMPAKARKGSVRAALSLKRNEGKLLIVDSFEMKVPKTKEAVAALEGMGVKSGVIVVDRRDSNLEKSVRNVPGFKILSCDGLNAYDLMRYEHVVVTVAALNRVQEVLKP